MSYSRAQVDDIIAPWLELCKKQEEALQKLEAERDSYGRQDGGYL